MGALAPGSAHARPSVQPPIATSGNFSAQMPEGGGCKKNEKCLESARKLIGKFFISSASVDGGLSGGSSVCRPGSEGPHRR